MRKGRRKIPRKILVDLEGDYKKLTPEEKAAIEENFSSLSEEIKNHFDKETFAPFGCLEGTLNQHQRITNRLAENIFITDTEIETINNLSATETPQLKIELHSLVKQMVCQFHNQIENNALTKQLITLLSNHYSAIFDYYEKNKNSFSVKFRKFKKEYKNSLNNENYGGIDKTLKSIDAVCLKIFRITNNIEIDLPTEILNRFFSVNDVLKSTYQGYLFINEIYDNVDLFQHAVLSRSTRDNFVLELSNNKKIPFGLVTGQSKTLLAKKEHIKSFQTKLKNFLKTINFDHITILNDTILNLITQIGIPSKAFSPQTINLYRNRVKKESKNKHKNKDTYEIKIYALVSFVSFNESSNMTINLSDMKASKQYLKN